MQTPQIHNNNVNNVLFRLTAICMLLCLTAFFTSCAILHSVQPGKTTRDINIPEPSPPPDFVRKGYNLDPFYQQWIDVEGLPVLASANVNPYALKEAAWLIRQMIEHRQDILQALVHNEVRFVVIAYKKKQDPSQIKNLISRPNYTETSIIFVNSTEENIAYYWLDYQGNERFYRQIAPKYAMSQTSHVGHYWVVKDMKGRNLAVFRAENKTGRAFVSANAQSQ